MHCDSEGPLDPADTGRHTIKKRKLNDGKAQSEKNIDKYLHGIDAKMATRLKVCHTDALCTFIAACVTVTNVVFASLVLVDYMFYFLTTLEQV